MSYENARYKNSGNDEGDVLNFFNNTLKNLIQKNGGDNTFSTYTEDFHDKDIPHLLGERTRVMLTHPNHTISQIEKSFIEMEVEFEVGFEDQILFKNFQDASETEFFDQAGINQIFIGFKDAVEIISECRFFVDGKLINEYHQNEMIRESYAYNSIRSKETKVCSPKSHSLWENVSNMSPNVCGVYIPLREFLWDYDHVRIYKKVILQLIIPFTDQLALQAWRLYPNRILGEIEEEIITSLDALVWCQLQPKKVGEILKTKIYYRDNIYNAPILEIANEFTQINRSSNIVDGMFAIPSKDLPYYADRVAEFSFCIEENLLQAQNSIIYHVNSNTLMLKPNSRPKIRIGRSNLFGFGIKPEVTQSLLESFHEPIIIPSQELTRYIFEQRATSKEINVKRFIPLRNATNITMMFPFNQNDCTVFQNIMCADFQLKVDKRLYPQIPFENSYCGRFIQYQLIANELDGVEATREYMESISSPLIGITNDGIVTQTFKNYEYDNTDFNINFQLERGNAGYVFDGLDTDTRDVLIEFRAKAIASEINDYFVAAYVDVPPCEMWICSDTYWTWSIDSGVQYHKDGIPAGYE